MTSLTMPTKGKGAAAMLQELNAEHAAQATAEIPAEPPKDIAPDPPPAADPPQATSAAEMTPPALDAAPKPGGAKRKATPPAVTQLAAQAPSLAADPREERLARALMQGDADDIVIVTVRVPARLNEYMDRYVERVNRIDPKRKYRKQDAVHQAFAAFFADHPLPPAPPENDDL